jgi:DNA-binding response OmpR family regulator
VVTRDELLREVWKQPFGGSNVVDVVVRGLRRKLGGNAWVIRTVKGHGYQYNRTEL